MTTTTMLDVFCDLDGVVADFHSQAMMLFDPYKSKGWRESEWACGEERMIPDVVGVTKEEFWNRVQRNQYFWIHMDRYPWAVSLIVSLSKYSDGRVRFLSSPGPNPSAMSGKREWINKHFPEHELILCKSDSKCLLAGPGRLLIDDLGSNCKEWTEHGGQSILFPRRWNANHDHSLYPLEYTLVQLGRILSEHKQKEEIPY